MERRKEVESPCKAYAEGLPPFLSHSPKKIATIKEMEHIPDERSEQYKRKATQSV